MPLLSLAGPENHTGNIMSAYARRAELPKMGRGDAAAATRIFRGDESRRLRPLHSVETDARLRYRRVRKTCRRGEAADASSS